MSHLFVWFNFAFASQSRNNFLTSAVPERARHCTQFVVILPPHNPHRWLRRPWGCRCCRRWDPAVRRRGR